MGSAYGRTAAKSERQKTALEQRKREALEGLPVSLSSELATARCQYGLAAPPISCTALAGFRIADL